MEQQPAAKGSSQLPRAAERGAAQQAAVTLTFLAVSLAPKRAFILHESKSIGVTSWLNIYQSVKC
jgi:hypothetical protein